MKPSILKDIMGTLGQKKFENADGEFLHGQYTGEADSAVLEDISGRITIKNSAKFEIKKIVSGTVMALKG